VKRETKESQVKENKNRFGVNTMHCADPGKGSATARRRFVESCSWSPNTPQDAMVGLGLCQTAGG